MDLDIKDRKILLELEKNARQSSFKIGKKASLPRDVVNYRIKKLEDSGIISHYMAIIDHSKLGQIQFKIYLQLQHLTKPQFEEMLSFLNHKKEVKWIAECNGRWDLIFAIITSTIAEFDAVKTEFLAKYSALISTKAITMMVSAQTLKRAYLLKDEKIINNEIYQLAGSEKAEFDKTDLKVLAALVEKPRASIIDLAKKAGVSTRAFSYKMRKLEDKKIILGYRVALDLEKIGYQFFKSFIYLENAPEKRIHAFLGFCGFHPNIIHTVKTIGNWDVEIELEVKNNEEFYEIISDLRDKFSDIIKTIETVIILKEHKFSYW